MQKTKNTGYYVVVCIAQSLVVNSTENGQDGIETSVSGDRDLKVIIEYILEAQRPKQLPKCKGYGYDYPLDVVDI